MGMSGWILHKLAKIVITWIVLWVGLVFFVGIAFEKSGWVALIAFIATVISDVLSRLLLSGERGY